MDDMREIEEKIKAVEEQETDPVSSSVSETVTETAPAVVEQSAPVVSEENSDNPFNLAAPAVLKAAQSAMAQAEPMVNDPKKVARHAKDLAEIANDMIDNQLDEQRLKNEKAASDNKVARKKIENELYEARQNGIRLKKEAKHLSKMQKARHKAERAAAYWEAHQSVLLQYGMHEGSPRVACNVILWLDGVKGFFNGVSKVSDAVMKALKYILIFGGAFGVLMIFPATRNWLLSVLGFIKK